ncbi:hypothetical protein THAOC_07815 [Thalassiosira oceanica]|uniref:Uncharacterized protein n=1 Tax=Thalassiosira oceanica TaxID=159749 RepID=K0SWM6_THAOC|nr:hypothetical protein THAOC_07815 [Thalassiosira oceanica]|eukprot:EJK70798.1 hypothetical protein THAOC_07815 [Thalassiosira oceanica]
MPLLWLPLRCGALSDFAQHIPWLVCFDIEKADTSEYAYQGRTSGPERDAGQARNTTPTCQETTLNRIPDDYFKDPSQGTPPPEPARIRSGRPVDLSWAHRANDERPRVHIKAIGVSVNQLDRPGGPLFAVRQITRLFYFKEPTLFLRTREIHGPLEPRGEVQRPQEEGHEGEVRQEEDEDRRAAQSRTAPSGGGSGPRQRPGRRRGVQDVVHTAQDQDRVDLATAGGAGAEEGSIRPSMSRAVRPRLPREWYLTESCVPARRQRSSANAMAVRPPSAADALDGTVADHGEAELAVC